MGRIVVPTWPSLQSSVDPRSFMRNGVRPSGPQVSGLHLGLLNHSLGHRLRRHFAKSIYPAQTVDNGGGSVSITTWRWLMRTMPNETEMQALFQFCPASSAAVNDNPQVWIEIVKDATVATIYDDGTSGTDKRVWNNTRIASPTSATLDSLTTRIQRYTLEGDTLYRCALKTNESARVLSLSCHGTVRRDLDTSVDTCVNPAKFLVNEAIAQDENADVLACTDTLWKRHGAAHITYSVDGTTATSITGTTETNLFDATATWTASTYGFNVHTLNRHSLDTTLTASPTYGVPVLCYVYASAAAGTGTVRFRWGTGGSDFIAITGITSAGWYKATGNIPGNADQKVDITALNSGANVTSVYAAGMFDYSA